MPVLLRLKIRPPSQTAWVQEIHKARSTIGRSPRNDLHLDDQFASRVHAELRVEQSALWLHDLGSVNGTFLNGRQVVGADRLKPGDQVQIGSTLLEIEAPNPSTVSPGTAAGTVGGLRPETVITRIPQRKDTAEVSLTQSHMLSVMDAVRQATGEAATPETTERRSDLFAVMADVGLALLSSSALDEVLQKILELIFEAVPADRAFLLLGSNGSLACKAASFRDPKAAEELPEVEISQSVHEVVMGQGQSVLTSDAQEDERFRNRDSIILSGVRSIMAVPLAVGDQRLGMIYVDSPMKVRVFTDDDRRLLTTIATVAAIRIHNALLLEQRIEDERIREQLNKARDLQSRLMPSASPAVEAYELVGISFPCFEVGGDYFDFVPLPSGRVLVTIGDVSGKGMDAAILMSSLHAAVRVLVLAGDTRDLAVLVSRINRYLFETTPANKFATFFAAELDAAGHRLRFCNAGHNPPLLVRRAGGLEELEASGPPLGMFEEVAYREKTVELAPGDVLTTCSDGIGEAMNSLGEEYGESRLAAVIRAHPESSAAALRDRVDESLLDFMGERALEDDVTLVLVKRVE